MPERLRTLRHCILTGGVVEGNGICSAAFCESAALRAAGSPSQSPSVTALPKGEPLAWRCSFWLKRKACGHACSPSGELSSVARLRGFKSAEPEKTVKRSSRRTGVNLQFFPVGTHFFRIVKGVQPLTTGCGTQHPLRALGGTRVLLAAAPTTAPCFRRWRRSQLLHCGVGGVQR